MNETYDDGLNLCESEGGRPPESLPEEFFYEPLDFFDKAAFDPEKFRKSQSYLVGRVRLALSTMEEEIEEVREMEDETDLLSSTFLIDSWRKLIEELEDSIRSFENLEELRLKILQCAVTFYKELLDPIRSIQQFDHLIHMCPDDPEHWGAYGLCLIEMSEQCLPSAFDMEKRSVLCFLRAARLSIAHLLARDSWLRKVGEEEAITLAKEYYYNASDAYPNPIARKGIFLVKMLSQAIPTIESLQDREIVFEEEDLTREVREILYLFNSRLP